MNQSIFFVRPSGNVSVPRNSLSSPLSLSRFDGSRMYSTVPVSFDGSREFRRFLRKSVERVESNEIVDSDESVE